METTFHMSLATMDSYKGETKVRDEHQIEFPPLGHAVTPHTGKKSSLLQCTLL